MSVTLSLLCFCFASRKSSLQCQGLLDDKAAGACFVAVNNLALASKLGMKRPNKAAECYDLTESQYLHQTCKSFRVADGRLTCNEAHLA